MTDQNTMLPFGRPVQVDIEEEIKRSFLNLKMLAV